MSGARRSEIDSNLYYPGYHLLVDSLLYTLSYSTHPSIIDPVFESPNLSISFSINKIYDMTTILIGGKESIRIEERGIIPFLTLVYLGKKTTHTES